jgi:hypothetical protein
MTKHESDHIRRARERARQAKFSCNGSSKSSEPALAPEALDIPPVADTWPAPPDAAAYYGLAGDIVRAIEPHSEADPVALLVQMLLAYGSTIGRSAHFAAEGDRHYLNEFAVLMVRTSKGRKGTSWGNVRRILEAADPAWVADHIQSGLSSGEGLIYAVRDPVITQQPVKEKGRFIEYEAVETDPGVTDKRLLVYEPEYASVLKHLERSGNTLSPILRQAWEAGDLRTLTKTSPTRATEAHISVIGHCTADELRRYLTATETANGFGNRHLWVCVRRSKALPDGGAFFQNQVAVLAERLRPVIEFGRRVGSMERDAEARAIWHDVYPSLSEGKPGMIGAMLARAEAHVMRLACMYALFDLRAKVGQEHMLAALALWEYCERSVRYVFGDSIGDPVADEILRLLRSSSGGVLRSEIMDYLGRNQSSARIGQALGLLLEHKLVRFERQQADDGRGRPAERWYAIAA